MTLDERLSPTQADLDAAHLLLTRMGVTARDLLEHQATARSVPTFAEYVPVVSTAVGDGARRVYLYYWQRVLDHWGDRRLTEPTASEVGNSPRRSRLTR